MRNPILFTFLFSTSILLAVSHVAGIKFGLYYIYTWLDLVLHGLGGIVVAFSFFIFSIFLPTTKQYLHLPLVLLGVFIVGVCWEIFEISIGMPYYEEGFFFDMTIDLVMDTLGGSIGYFIAKRIETLA